MQLCIGELARKGVGRILLPVDEHHIQLPICVTFESNLSIFFLQKRNPVKCVVSLSIGTVGTVFVLNLITNYWTFKYI
jgi:hypothetical protein